MVPSFLYDRAESALPGTPLPLNPSWSTEQPTLPWSIGCQKSSWNLCGGIQQNILPVFGSTFLILFVFGPTKHPIAPHGSKLFHCIY